MTRYDCIDENEYYRSLRNIYKFIKCIVLIENIYIFNVIYYHEYLYYKQIGGSFLLYPV